MKLNGREQAPVMAIDAALAEREAAGRPIRVGMVGAGATGRAIALQLGTPVPGIRLVAIANRTLRHGERAWRESGADAWRCADSAREAATAIAAGVPVLTDNPSDRKSTRLNSRHPPTSYAVFFFEKKNIP